MSRTYWKNGDWNGLCDVCGKKFKSSQLRERWDGLRVCKKDYEQRHPSDFVRGRPDNQSVPWTRPENTDVEVSGMYIEDNDYWAPAYTGVT